MLPNAESKSGMLENVGSKKVASLQMWGAKKWHAGRCGEQISAMLANVGSIT